MTENAEMKVKFEARPLVEDEILALEALIQTPVFGSMKRLLAIQRIALMNDLIAESDANQMRNIQGRIQGINLIEKLPEVVAQYGKKIREKRAEEEKKAKKKKPQ